MLGLSTKNILFFFIVCLPCAVVGAILVHALAISFDTMPGGVFCVDGMCNGHSPKAYLLQNIRSLLVVYLSVLIWFMAGMKPAEGFDKSIKKRFLILLSLAALVPLFFVVVGSSQSQVLKVVLGRVHEVVLAGIATVWIPRFNKQILGLRK